MRTLFGMLLAAITACSIPTKFLTDGGHDDGSDGPAIDAVPHVLSQQAYIKASNTGMADMFGEAVALSGDGSTLAVSAIWEESAATGIGGDQLDNSAAKSGAVYVFVRAGATWTQQGYLKASNTDANDYFGTIIALSTDGSTLAVSAPGEDSAATGIDGNGADNTASASGAVYVFTRAGLTWTQQAYVKASNTGAGDNFGSSVAISADGSTLAVGAGGLAGGEDSAAVGVNPVGGQSNNAASDSGAVYVFTRAGVTWTQQAYVKASNTDASDEFGTSVALAADGSTLVVGADSESSAAAGINGNQSDNSVPYAGAVYVFTRVGVTWTQRAYLKASNPWQVSHFGNSVAVAADGSTLAVGSYGDASAATGVNGDQSDHSLVDSAGAVYVFTRAGTTWSQQAYVKASNTGSGDNFGKSVTLAADGSLLAVGAMGYSGGEDSAATGINGDQTSNAANNSGAVYLFTRAGVTWTQADYIKASNTDAGDGFGSSVALSANAFLAVGAGWYAGGESSAATGINGEQADNSLEASGAAYVFE